MAMEISSDNGAVGSSEIINTLTPGLSPRPPQSPKTSPEKISPEKISPERTSPVVMLDKDPALWLDGMQHDRAKSPADVHNSQVSWRNINNQISQSIIGTGVAMKQMVEQIEVGAHKIDTVSVSNDKLNGKLQMMAHRVEVLEDFASKIAPTLKDLMATVNTLVFNIQGYAGASEIESKKAAKHLEAALPGKNKGGRPESRVSFADDHGEELSSISPATLPSDILEACEELANGLSFTIVPFNLHWEDCPDETIVLEESFEGHLFLQTPSGLIHGGNVAGKDGPIKKSDLNAVVFVEEMVRQKGVDPKDRMTPNTANKYDEITRNSAAKCIQRNWQIYRHNNMIRAIADMSKVRVKKGLSVADRLKDMESKLKQIEEDQQDNSKLDELMQKIWEEVETKANKTETKAINETVCEAVEQISKLQATLVKLSTLREEIETQQEKRIKVVEDTIVQHVSSLDGSITKTNEKCAELEQKIADTKPPEIDLTGFLREEDLNTALTGVGQKIEEVEQKQLRKEDIEYEVKPVQGKVKTLSEQLVGMREVNEGLTAEASATRERLAKEMEEMALLKGAIDAIRRKQLEDKNQDDKEQTKDQLKHLEQMLSQANEKSRQKALEVKGLFGSLDTRLRKQNNSLVTDLNGLKVEVAKKAGEDLVKEAFEKIETEIAPVTESVNVLQESIDGRTTKKDVISIVNQIKLEAEEKGKGSAGLKCLMCNQDLKGLTKLPKHAHQSLPYATKHEQAVIEARLFGGPVVSAHPLRRAGALRPVRDRNKSPVVRDGYGLMRNERWGREHGNSNTRELYNEKVARSSMRRRAKAKRLRPMAYSASDGHLHVIDRTTVTVAPPQINARTPPTAAKPKAIYPETTFTSTSAKFVFGTGTIKKDERTISDPRMSAEMVGRLL